MNSEAEDERVGKLCLSYYMKSVVCLGRVSQPGEGTGPLVPLQKSEVSLVNFIHDLELRREFTSTLTFQGIL